MAINHENSSKSRWSACVAAHPPGISGAISTSSSIWDLAQRVMDVTLAALLLVMSMPVVLLAALATKLTSAGPVLYCQTRTGKGGQPYTIYKIRTMFHNCEKATGASWSTPGDTRITAVGRFLRRTHIDELPQLWNILRGDMSLVGPRPERPEFVVKLEQLLSDYRRRLEVRPGLTGLAQIQLPPDTDFHSVSRKLAYDLYYIEHRSLWLDFRIILATAGKVLAVPFAACRLLLQLPCSTVVETGQPALAPDSPDAMVVTPALSSMS